jgi:hypothetical protein
MPVLILYRKNVFIKITHINTTDIIMQSIMNISETPLNSRSIMIASRFSEKHTDETDQSESSGGASPEYDLTPVKYSTAKIREQIRKSYMYYAIDLEERPSHSVLYTEGVEEIQKLSRGIFESLVGDKTWSDRTSDLFDAVQFAESLHFSDLCTRDKPARKKDGLTVEVDMYRTGLPNKVKAEDCWKVIVIRNPLFYWERECELNAHLRSTNEDVTTLSEPGTLEAYSQRFLAAATLEDGSKAKVIVRFLEDGVCKTCSVRPEEAFIVESKTQATLLQCAYEIFNWFIRVQGTLLSDWKRTTNQEEFVDNETKRLMRKFQLIECLSCLNLPLSKEDGEEKQRQPGLSFEGFWKLKCGLGKTKKVLKEEWKRMSALQKESCMIACADSTLMTPAPETTADATPTPPHEETNENRVKKKAKIAPSVPPMPVDDSHLDEQNTLLLKVFKHNMMIATANGNLPSFTPFDAILKEALQLPEETRVSFAHTKIVNMITESDSVKSEGLKDMFRCFTALFGGNKKPVVARCIF